mgnify:CR=1 FL=1
MNRYQTVSTVEEQYKVRDIDEAIRTLRRQMSPPWVIKKSTLRVFTDVLQYPVAADHDVLAYLDNSIENQSSTASNWQPNADFIYTSLQEFYYNGPRNKIVEIWEGGTKSLGIRYDSQNASSALVSGTTLSNYTNSGGAGAPFEEQVITINGINSIGFSISSSPSTMVETMGAFQDENYKTKYYFRWVYLTSVPTSIVLRFGNDASNYIGATVTAQFGGQDFVANDWNLIAIDLNGTATGTIDDSAFDYAYISIVGPTSGNAYLGPAYLRSWVLMDYWYYSIYNVRSASASVLDKEYFYNDTTNAYNTSDMLVGESEWIDVITFDAILTTLADSKNTDVIQLIQSKREKAWEKIQQKYPDMSPVIITSSWNFGTQFPYSGLDEDNNGIIY